MAESSRFPLRSVVFILCLIFATPVVFAQRIIERLTIYSSAQPTGFKPHVWNMSMQQADGGLRDQGRCLWFNTDWQAKPWGGVRFEEKKTPTFTVTREWLDKGFIRLHINVTVDRQGNIGGGDSYQILPITDPPLHKYQAVRSQFIDRGRGIDEETGTWQETLIPLKYFTDIKPGHIVRGLSFQTQRQIQRVFSLDDIEFVRFDELPNWMIEQLNQNVMQEWVDWSPYDKLPEVVQADKHPISIRDGKFVNPNGSRAFLLNPYCREDSRICYGNQNPGKLPPTWDLYSRQKHGWIYDETPTTQTLCRLGFNSYSVTPDPQDWWNAAGFQVRNGSNADSFLPVLANRVTLPYFVDLVSWPWTMGAPGLHVDQTKLPPQAATQGRNHWTQYRIIGAGRQAWLDMWAANARRYRDAGVKVAVLELMNEPAYMGETADHHAEFQQWLKQRYGTVEAVNRVWATKYATLAQAAAYRFDYGKPTPDGQQLDYDEYLATRFEQLIAAGVDAVRQILPDSLVGLQPMSGYLQTPREAVWKHRIARDETVVLTPTGGGRWTLGSGASQPTNDVTTHPMADAPIENDLLLAIADNKMIVDNETYLRGQTRVETRNRLWEHVVCGLDGLTVFSWSKRGWVWWKDRANVQVDADKYPYASLIPLARRTDALRGILDFSIEVQSLAPMILSKPWGPAPKVGLLYSWANARRRVVETELHDKVPAYYAAMRYSHWNMRILPSDEVIETGVPDGIEIVVAGGLTHVEPQLSASLKRFVESGGTLILGECDFTRDVYNRQLPAGDHLAANLRTGQTVESDANIPVSADTEKLFPGSTTAKQLEKLRVSGAASVVLADRQHRPAVTRMALGKGTIYYQGADAFGYSLAKILHATLMHANPRKATGEWLAARITENDGRLAPNVLVSRRSYPDRHAILLHNRNRYERTVHVALPGLDGRWQVRQALTDEPSQTVDARELGQIGIKVHLEPTGPAVILLERSAKP